MPTPSALRQFLSAYTDLPVRENISFGSNGRHSEESLQRPETSEDVLTLVRFLVNTNAVANRMYEERFGPPVPMPTGEGHAFGWGWPELEDRPEVLQALHELRRVSLETLLTRRAVCPTCGMVHPEEE